MFQKKLSLKNKNSITGILFISPFIIGFLLFMAAPMLQSIMMVFSDVSMNTAENRFDLNFTGFENINFALTIDPDFLRMMVEELTRMALIVPAIIIFSLFISILLNQKFKGRGLVRAIFFLPVIMTSGVILGLETNNSMLYAVADTIREQNAMRGNITNVLENIFLGGGAAGAAGLNDFLEYIFFIVNQIHAIAMASGIQIIIFLSGLQLIPKSLFESSRIEGATEWENFWKITFPMLSPLILVNVVYSVVDFMIRTDNTVMEHIRASLMQRLEFGLASAMAWIYFLIVAIVLAIIGAIISKRVYYYE